MDPREDSHCKNTANAAPTNRETFICPRCCKSFSAKLIAAHQLWHLNQDEKAEKDEKLKKAKVKKAKIRYQCEYCDKSFDLKKFLTRHTLIHTGEKSYKCDQCDYAAGRIDHLQRHKKRKHKTLSQNEISSSHQADQQSVDSSTTFIISSEIQPIKQEGELKQLRFHFDFPSRFHPPC